MLNIIKGIGIPIKLYEVNVKHLIFFIVLLFAAFLPSCQEDNPVTPSGMRTVRYEGVLTPVDSLDVFRSFTYTNENGGRSQSAVNTVNGTFVKTVQIKSGTVVELTANGYTTQSNNYIGGNVTIIVDENILAESNAAGRKGSNTITVTAKLP